VFRNQFRFLRTAQRILDVHKNNPFVVENQFGDLKRTAPFVSWNDKDHSTGDASCEHLIGGRVESEGALLKNPLSTKLPHLGITLHLVTQTRVLDNDALWPTTASNTIPALRNRSTRTT
jgi:hypothetical protein